MTSGGKVAMHWFRKGLRLHDNPALLSSLQQSPKEFYPVYIMDGDSFQLLHCTALRANFLVESLQDLDKSLRKCGSRLYVASGDPCQVLPQLWNQWNVTHVSYELDETGEPYALQRDESVCKLAKEHDVAMHGVASETLHPLALYAEKSGGDNSVPSTMGTFTTLLNKKMPSIPKPLPSPKKDDFPSFQHDDTQYLPPQRPTDLPWPRNVPKSQVTPVWTAKDCENLTPIVHGGETNAMRQLHKSMKSASWVAKFEKPKTSCTEPNGPSTTGLSAYMTLGCISPRTFWYAIDEAIHRANATASKPPVSLHGQLMWRDFNNLIAYAANKKHPGSWGGMKNNMYSRQIPWDDDDQLLQSWKDGQTGFPWIDACMAQLRTEGWIHHLGRHAVACFLTRGDLWQSWEKGAEHFEAELLDADYGLNTFNWLWLSCSGFFYQYFRCYSPVAFQKKNDPSGRYIKKYLPVLAKLPEKYIYEPWKAPPAVLKTAGIQLGTNYPHPIVDHTPTSKLNMAKMKEAYDQHKAMAASGGGGPTKSKPASKTASAKTASKRPTKKKVQTKIKF